MKLKEFRKSKKITQKELAEKIGVSQQYISHWEVGRREMSVKNAKKIAEILNVKNWWELYSTE